MKAEDLINYRQLSRTLTGSPIKIHSKFTPKEYKKSVDDLLKLINYWLEGKIIVTEDEINSILGDFLIFAKEKLTKT